MPPRTTLALLALAALAPAVAPARAADPAPSGNYKLVLINPFSENELMLFRVSGAEGKLRGQVLDSAQLAAPPQVTRVEARGDKLGVTVELGNLQLRFEGKPDRSGAYRGTLSVQNQTAAARLDPTKAETLEKKGQRPSTAIQAYVGAMNETDMKARVKKLCDVVAKAPGDPQLAAVYGSILESAEAAGLPDDDVRKLVGEWVEGARPFGDDYAANVRAMAVKALSGKKAYAPLTLQLATEAEKALGESAPVETRAELAQALARAARDAGKADVADAADARARKLEAQLDEEYHKKVPPFKPERSEASKRRGSDRVVLFELFTGAQCPPCVAADVAFDALNLTYTPKEVVTLQYHLHIPGPDPLTSPDSVARAGYYPDFSGTPTTVLNGKPFGTGGGGMNASKAKYDEYRQLVDRALAEPGAATIDLKATRQGDTVSITALARAKADAGSKPRLRLALVEEQVRYVGGNNLRFHHHVVRALPGGPDGKPLDGGKATTELTVKLGDLRKTLETYLDTFSKENGTFPGKMPPIDLTRLSVAAFVQDDADKRVLNAALVPLAEAK